MRGHAVRRHHINAWNHRGRHRAHAAEAGRPRFRPACHHTSGAALGICGAAIHRWIRNRFEPDEWAGWVVATMFASVIIPAVVVSIGGGWAFVVEIIRLGNEHVGNRARIEGLRAHVIAVLGIGFAAVWIGSGLAALRKRAERNGRSDWMKL